MAKHTWLLSSWCWKLLYSKRTEWRSESIGLDLSFWRCNIQHVAIMLGFTAFIHAPTPLLQPVIATAPSVHMATHFFYLSPASVKKYVFNNLNIYLPVVPPCTSSQKKKKSSRIFSPCGYKQVQLERCWLYLLIHPAELQSDSTPAICVIVLTGYQRRDPQFSSPLNYLTKEQL